MTVRLSKIRQRFERNGLHDPILAVREQLARLDERIPPRARIAIAVGSRGINNLASIVREVVAYVKGRGAQPFIVPAMGSHGGATAEGQADVLRAYGVSEQTCVRLCARRWRSSSCKRGTCRSARSWTGTRTSLTE